MNAIEEILEAYGRLPSLVREAVGTLSAEQLVTRLDVDANSIAWLIWPLSRIQDDHVAAVAGREQVWTSEGWAARFGLPFPVTAHGWGHTSEEVGQVRADSGDLLTGYYDAV